MICTNMNLNKKQIGIKKRILLKNQYIFNCIVKINDISPIKAPLYTLEFIYLFNNLYKSTIPENASKEVTGFLDIFVFEKISFFQIILNEIYLGGHDLNK